MILPSPVHTSIDAEAILKDVFGADSRRYDIVRRHGEQVAQRALRVAAGLDAGTLDKSFLYEAAVLHDIGIVMTETPQLDCHGGHPYICHGILGRRMLEERGLPRHALVCERHVGVGISLEEIRARRLPLPLRDMQPVTIGEKIVCYADKFYSKTNGGPAIAKTFPEVVNKLRKYGRRQAGTFIRWAQRFEGLVLDPEERPNASPASKATGAENLP